jgi:tRNA threonylcarbamoyladenosine biosynthesis protein TsaE
MPAIHIQTEKKIDNAAEEFVRLMGNDLVFAFYGSMGAGKTTFIKAICKQLKVTDNVSSPTFALINEYESEEHGLIYHFDLYRIKKIEELYDIGYEDYFYGGQYCFIEWPEKAEELLPKGVRKIYIFVNEDGSRTLSEQAINPHA